MPDAVAQTINRPVTIAELRDALDRPIDAAEREDVLALIRWFARRYPAPQARLAYLRQAYRRWQPSERSGSAIPQP